MHVELYAAQPRDYFAYEQLEEKKRATPPGKRVYAHDYTIGDHFAGEAHVDLRPALGAAGTGHVIAIATEGNTEIPQQSEATIEVPPLDWMLQPLLAVVPLQLLAYRIARRRGLNVDQPRNLAKTVTVE